MHSSSSSSVSLYSSLYVIYVLFEVNLEST